ncbi:hypothetical protein MTQ00_13215 [Chryseobacterium sp. B21-037]|uniref:hypothetical protein n=1 Tax=Chryseobacterium sp. B21-037 TaxID=2926038 RepID=UPI0023589A81|nr:hypothetical protein [Chryseobacterium sp. B21-037]MDC8105496.1 hypothetical protein [Chryseobacterium sp. B21-037]
MENKIILKLLLLVVFSISLYSCIHDEVTSASDPSSKEYTNKSLWKEDEKYIKNVMKVYQENESEIKKGNGTPLWDYATTMDSFDESFLMVPVVDNGKVLSVLQVPRHGSKIYFIYKQSQNDISFFQNYISPRVKKAINTESNSNKGGLVCSTKTISVWLPNNESNPDPDGGDGEWVSSRVTTCRVIDAPIEISDCLGIVDPVTGLCDMGTGGGGGTGYPYPDTPETPCDKMKTQNSSVDFKNKVTELDKPEIFKKTQETGYAVAYGPQINYESLANTDNDNLKLPPGNKYFGFMHVHLDKEGVVKIFSPADLFTFLTSCVRNAQDKGLMVDAFGMVITSQGNYILKYSGDGSFGIGPNTLANWQSWYEKEYSNLKESELANSGIVEKIFTQFLEEKVKINGLEFYKSDKATGNTTKLKFDGKDKPVNPTPCP